MRRRVYRDGIWDTRAAGIGTRAQVPSTRYRGWHGGYGCDALGLSDAFIVGEKEGSVLKNRSANRSAKLVALERRDGLRMVIEIVFRVQPAVPKELVNTSVNLVRSRPRNGIPD